MPSHSRHAASHSLHGANSHSIHGRHLSPRRTQWHDAGDKYGTGVICFTCACPSATFSSSSSLPSPVPYLLLSLIACPFPPECSVLCSPEPPLQKVIWCSVICFTCTPLSPSSSSPSHMPPAVPYCSPSPQIVHSFFAFPQ